MAYISEDAIYHPDEQCNPLIFVLFYTLVSYNDEQLYFTHAPHLSHTKRYVLAQRIHYQAGHINSYHGLQDLN